MDSSLRHPGRAALLVAFATTLNLITIELPGEARFFLGPFVYMPLVLTLRLPWSILAAAIPMAATIGTLGHPFAFTLATLEAVWLALARRRWRRASILQDAIYWAVIGLPAVVGLCYFKGGLPADLVFVVATKQLLNQLAAVIVAVFLLRHSQLAAWIEERSIARRQMRSIVFQSVFVLAMTPLVVAAVGVSALLWAYCQREDREVLGEAAERHAGQLDLFVDTHAAAVTSVANTLSRAGGDPAIMLEELRRAHPAFRSVLLADAAGDILLTDAAAGPARSTVTTVADREYFRRTRELNRTLVSGVFRGRVFGREILFVISAPLHDASGNFAGVVRAALEVERFARQIAGEERNEQVRLIFADSEGRVIHADREAEIPALVALRYFPQMRLLEREVDPAPRRFDQAMTSGRVMRFTGWATRSPRLGMIVIAERPLLAGLAGSGWVYLMFGGIAAAVLAAAGWVARTARIQAAAPLEYFARAATRQAALRMVEPLGERFDRAPYEVSIVFRAFNLLAVQLQASYALLRQANAELDRRVVDRTKEADAARRQAEAANRSKTDFLAMTSHEIRTPLNAMIGLADAVVENATDPVAAARLRTIRNSGRRLLGVVNDLLDLARVEAGRLELRPTAVEIGALGAEVRDLFDLRAREQGLQFDCEVAATLPLWVEADGPRLQQVLINLVGNALKFTPAGRVCLRIEEVGATPVDVTLRLAVSDTGPGIPADQQADLFLPFVQLPGAAQSSTPGTGLGLAISRRLVGLFGGTLAIRSAVGEGTEFFFTATLRRGAAPATVVPLRPPAGLRVLAADDHPANQEVLRSILESQCAQLEIVDSADAALAALARAEFDVALIDLEMPQADGFSVARAVRAWRGTEASRDCRLVAFSAHGREQMWARCVASGFQDFVAKPIDRSALMRVLCEGPAVLLT